MPLVVALVLLCLALGPRPSALGQAPAAGVVRGLVVDSTTGLPRQGATVTIVVPGVPQRGVRTDTAHVRSPRIMTPSTTAWPPM